MIKKEIRLLAVCLLLCGCTATPFSDDNPYKVDTVVQIPVDPTEEPTETEAEETAEETVIPTETVPAETTAPKTTTSSNSSKSSSSSSSKSSSSSSKTSTSGSKSSATKATEAAATEAPTEEPTEAPPEVPTEAPTEVPTEPPTESPATEAPTEPPYDPGSYSVGSLEYAIAEQMNSHRADTGAAALSVNSRLCGIAALRAQEVCASWSHTRPDGRSYTSAMSDYGFGFGAAAESLVYVSGGADAASIVDKWMSSEEHAGYILSSGFTTVGIGVYSANGYTYIAVLYTG